MFTEHVMDAMAFSILIAAVIAIIRYRKIDRLFLPFILCIWAASVTEILGDILARRYDNNLLCINTYTLVEALLLTWQFNRWGLLRRPRWLFPAILSALCVFWFGESRIWKSFDVPINYFQIIESLLIASLSLVLFNRMIHEENRNLLRNAIFIICIAFVIYFTLDVIVGLFWLYSLQLSLGFQKSLGAIILVVNALCNLIYALAILWMPRKQRFSMLY